ncbi:hypothetical protein BBR47_31550 [Brevibacillus brevis NBRC 100599]|uniref:Uncharacterized protein n=1 Tax=Brevibacillus brevis (strain 47 / JCM 6285 / NBRC 100599) TaxID=358681 RepID=C0ZEC3_BREBN|nr:hypothetical protein BBR47_31550 [Brevibacillus brevis NBRC 100599]
MYILFRLDLPSIMLIANVILVLTVLSLIIKVLVKRE